MSTQSNALLKSNKTAKTALPSLKEYSVLSTNSDKARVVKWPSLNLNWGMLRTLNLVKNSRNDFIAFLIILS